MLIFSITYYLLITVCFLCSPQGKLVDISPDKQKEYDESLINLKKAYGADKEDFNKFPTFTFPGKKKVPKFVLHKKDMCWFIISNIRSMESFKRKKKVNSPSQN